MGSRVQHPRRTAPREARPAVGQLAAASDGPAAPALLCLVPRALPQSVTGRIERLYRHLDSVEVIVERRGGERRARADRRRRPAGQADPWLLGDVDGAPVERRRIHNLFGRRVADRRAELLPVLAPPIVRGVARYLHHLRFVERSEPSPEALDDTDTARLVARFQAGQIGVFDRVYERYADRVYRYLRVALRDAHEAEDATQEVFMKVFRALPRYEFRGVPVRIWLFRVARNYALECREHSVHVEATDPLELNHRRELAGPGDELQVPEWLSADELLMLIERLPVNQRQVLFLRFMLGMDLADVAHVLGCSPNAVSQVQCRAFDVLRKRLIALGRHPAAGPRRLAMRRLGGEGPASWRRRPMIACPAGGHAFPIHG